MNKMKILKKNYKKEPNKNSGTESTITKVKNSLEGFSSRRQKKDQQTRRLDH